MEPMRALWSPAGALPLRLCSTGLGYKYPRFCFTGLLSPSASRQAAATLGQSPAKGALLSAVPSLIEGDGWVFIDVGWLGELGFNHHVEDGKSA